MTESEKDRFTRQLYASLLPKAVATAVISILVLSLMPSVQGRIARSIPGPELQHLYLTVSYTLVATPAIVGIMGAVVGYYYRLRTRMFHWGGNFRFTTESSSQRPFLCFSL